MTINLVTISKLIRDLVIATHGGKVFRHHSEIDPKMFEQFCLEALGIISGYREIVRGYLSLQGAVIADELESDQDQLKRSNSDDEVKGQDKIEKSIIRKSNIAEMFEL